METFFFFTCYPLFLFFFRGRGGRDRDQERKERQRHKVVTKRCSRDSLPRSVTLQVGKFQIVTCMGIGDERMNKGGRDGEE